MTRLSRKKHNAAVYGWVKWVPPLLALFSVIFADIWLSVESRRTGYALSELNAEVARIEEERADIDVTADTRKNFDRLAELAGDLGLRDAKPEQQINLKVFPDSVDSIIAIDRTPVIEPAALDYGVKADIVALDIELPQPETPPAAALDESNEAMLASL